MSFATKYRTANERAGNLNRPIRIFTPVTTFTATGGDRVQWVEWRHCKANVRNLSGNEAVDADRPVAVNVKGFDVRRISASGVNETMLILLDGQYYDIRRIDPSTDAPRQYIELVAERRDTSASPVQFLTNNLYMDYAQTFANVTADYVTVTAGTLPDTDEVAASTINQLLFVFRGGLRLVYGESGDGGYTIVNATNRIVPNMELRGENLLVHQYSAT